MEVLRLIGETAMKDIKDIQYPEPMIREVEFDLPQDKAPITSIIDTDPDELVRDQEELQ